MQSTVALLIIDMQEALVRGAYQERQVLDRIQALTKKARGQQVPVVYIQHSHATFEVMQRGQPGWKIHHRIALEPDDTIVEKIVSDAFYCTDLEASLHSFGIQTVAIAGMMTEYCIDTTAKAALSRNFNVILLTDCHTTGDSELSAQEITSHHNVILPKVVHPDRSIRAVASTQLTFT